MKARKLKKYKQEQQGWPNTIKHCSTYGYSNFYFEKIGYEGKFVHCAIYITSWPRQAWRPRV